MSVRLPRFLKSLLGNPAERRRLMHEGALFSSRIISIAASVITAGISARILGVEDRGLFFYGLVVAASIAQFGNLGMASSNFYFMARDPELRLRILAGTLAVTVAMSALAVIVFQQLTGLPELSPWRTGVGGLLLFLVTVMSLLNMTVPVCLIGEQRHVAAAWAQIGGTLLGIGFCLLAWRFWPTIEGFTWAVVAGILAIVAPAGALLMRGKSRKAAPGFTREWLLYGLRAFPFLILSGFVLRSTVFIGKPLLDPVAFGQISIAYQIFEAMVAVPATISMVMFPRIVSGNQLQVSVFRTESTRILVIVAALGLIALAAFPLLVPLVFGPAYAPAVPLALLYLPGLMGYSVLSIAGNFLAALRFPWQGLLGWIAAIFLTGLGALAGGLFRGGVGLALGTSVGLIASAAVFAMIITRELRKERQHISKESTAPSP